jgi:cysteine desulfurase
MRANNEIGTIEPIKEISQIVKAKGIYFHTDAVQTVAHIPVKVDDLDADLLSLSAHKFYGPKGVGAIYIRKGTKIQRFMQGGGQEKGKRSSTENTPGIVGLAKAVELAKNSFTAEADKCLKLRDKLIKGIQAKIPEVYLNGHPTKRLPNNVNFSIKYVEGESMLLNLDMLGIAVSTGSACTSATLEPSHVLLAIGRDHALAHGSLRFSLGKYTTEEDIDYVLQELPKVVDKLRKMSPLYEKKD